MITKPLKLWAAALAVVILVTGLLLTAPRNVNNSEAVAGPTAAEVGLTAPQPPANDAPRIEPADVFEPGFDFVPAPRHR